MLSLPHTLHPNMVPDTERLLPVSPVTGLQGKAQVTKPSPAHPWREDVLIHFCVGLRKGEAG